MRLYQKSEHALRIYIEGSPVDLGRLYTSLSTKFFKEKSGDWDKEDDVDNILFIEEESYYFPVGLLPIVSGELTTLGIPHEIDIDSPTESYKDYSGVSADILQGIQLRAYQVEGIKLALSRKRGLLQLGTGAGKTEMMIAIAKYLHENLEGNILICVPTVDLLNQTYDRMVSRGIDEKSISKYGGGNKVDTSRRIVVSTVQTAFSRLNDEEFVSWYQDLLCIMLDEAQHGACLTWYTLIDRVAPEYIIGVSAEPFYGDKDHRVRDLILRGTVGSVLYRVPLNYLVDHGYLSKPYMIALDTQYPGDIYKLLNWQVVNKLGIINNSSRNNLIRDTALMLIDMSKNPLILVQQISHGNKIAELISSAGRRVAVLTGGLKVSIYLDGNVIDTFKDSDNQVKSDFQKGLYDAIIGTSVLDEGVDIPALSSVILAGGSKSKLKLIQRLGRGLRLAEGKLTTIIVDFRDRFNVVLHSHFKKRNSTYTEHNIPCYYCNDIKDFSTFVLTCDNQRRAELNSIRVHEEIS